VWHTEEIDRAIDRAGKTRLEILNEAGEPELEISPNAVHGFRLFMQRA